MIGFFEHQYLSFKKNHLKNLISLAKADGHLHPDEEKLIYKIGDKYGLKDRQIASLLRSNKKNDLHIPDNHDEKMDQLYDVIMMVYADGIVEDSEIEFCNDLVDQFGYNQEIVSWLINLFDEGKIPTQPEWKELKKEAETKFQAS
ncbi:TerB family tellurite resistance protein [Fulvivirga lutimaris]|uniref:tellurite resistance TerB family protein n=1 Tax=Fulvivirga lutimaris TaxID=1819566 RepID=UPI0012BD3983|nr:TerB family tellurite resistance protein [Fulvivirga lutimaris]MTI38995.1 TerB family tellurite resistance protein [Fulvivirga lutimaris]